MNRNTSRAKSFLPLYRLLPKETRCAAYWIRLWCDATRWQRAVDAELRPFQLSFTRYMLLDLAEILEGTGAFKQRALVEETQLAESAVSSAVRALEELGWLERGPCGISAREWRINVTDEGRERLALARPIVDELAARFFEG